MITYADMRAHIAARQASAVGCVPRRISPDQLPAGEPDVPGRWSHWRVGQAIVGMPELSPRAPGRIRRLYRAAIVAQATGRCPRCDGAGLLDPDHAPGCELDAPDAFDGWLDEEADRWVTALRHGEAPVTVGDIQLAPVRVRRPPRRSQSDVA